MTVVGNWRATYTPGEWLVLCGPTSLVVIEPPGEGWTPLVEELWQQVLASSSLVDLAARLAGYGLDTMPSFGALFWSADGMRSLVRGSVRVVDPASDRVIAHGAGIQTWSEVGLDGLRIVLVQTGTPGPAEGDPLRLPLAVGAVRASTVLLDARDQARLHSPQLDPTTSADQSAEADLADGLEPTELLPEPDALPAPVGASGVDPAQQAMESADTELVPVAADLGSPPVPAAPPPGPTVEALVCPHGHPNPPKAERCRDCGVPLADRRTRRVAQPLLAVLRVSDGNEAPLDKPVLVGRAPAERGPGPVRLLTVPSPSHDISRTHLQVTAEDWLVLVTDLHSTNGTLLVDPTGSTRRSLPPGRAVAVELGSVLELADGVTVSIDRPQ
nr:FHA domain-containing protein [uncultured Friedmanniella sp.]